jgi:hypothetical protein
LSEINQVPNLRLVRNVRAAERSTPATFFDQADGLLAARFVDVGNDYGGALGGPPSGNGTAAA